MRDKRIMASVGNEVLILILMMSSLQLCTAASADDSVQTSTECASDAAAAQDGGDRLVFAHIIFRHGQRNIEKTYPNDPWQSESLYWPEGFGALTNVGKQQVFELGKYLRRRYHKIVGKSYSPKKVFIQSTDFDRTLMSAQVLAAAMFPPIGQQLWNKDLKWTPVPIHTRPLDQELLLPWHIPCPKFKILIENYRQSVEYKSVVEQYSDLIRNWEINAGQKLPRLADVMFLFDTLFVENEKGLALPKWAVEALKNPAMEYLSAFHLTSFTNSTGLQKLEAGFLIKQMLDRFKQKSLSSLEPDRLWIYSAHDLTIVNILNALSLYDLKIPKYASSLHLELYQHDNNYYIQLFYRKTNGGSSENSLPLNIPNCGNKCELDEFYRLYADILPSEDYESACKLSK